MTRFPWSGGVLDVSRETTERLERYAGLLQKWNPRINLVARASMGDLWTRHFVDSAQLWPHVPKTARSMVDLGSGAGFPGLVLAILATEFSPALVVTLVESDERKSAFLRTVARECAIFVNVETARIEALAPIGADVVTARALADLPVLLSLAGPHLAEGGKCLFLKGKSFSEELTAARRDWHMDVVSHMSVTEPAAAVLEIGAPRRVG